MRNEKLIILIPFAGGNVYSLKGLEEELRNFDVLSLELPGRGRRIREELLTDLDAIIEDQYKIIIEKVVDYKEYYIYGHSMGTLLGYLLTHKLITNWGNAPKHLFVSGRGGPSKEEKEEKTYLLPSKEFKEKLREIGGSPDEVLANEDLMSFFEPILRADFEVIERYEHQIKEPFDVPITGLYGRDEETTYDEMLLWQQETTHPVVITEFPGNHFFVFDHWEKISTIIDEVIKTTSPSSL